MKDLLDMTFETWGLAYDYSNKLSAKENYEFRYKIVLIKDTEHYGLQEFTADEYWLYFDKEGLHIENHLRYISRSFDEPDGLEYFEVFRDQRTGMPKLDINYFPEEEEND